MSETHMLVEVKNLQVQFDVRDGIVKAIDGANFAIKRGQTLGIIGESGCGKSMTAKAIMNMVPRPGKIVGGEIIYHRRLGGNGVSEHIEQVSITKLDPDGDEIRKIRGGEIAMIFQEPMTSLNPVYTIGNQIMEAIILHQKLKKREAKVQAIEMLRAVGIPLPEQRVNEYPHQLSGGMRQRAMIAMAMSCNPSLLIADEPTTALDVTIQAQVLELMNALRSEFQASIQFITHDLGVIAGMADDVVVMYLGRIVEASNVREVFHNPKHPYTQGLMHSIPSLAADKKRLEPIKGVVPDPFEVPPGCGFEPRCPQAMEICKTTMPDLKEVAPGHTTACWLYE